MFLYMIILVYIRILFSYSSNVILLNIYGHCPVATRGQVRLPVHDGAVGSAWARLAPVRVAGARVATLNDGHRVETGVYFTGGLVFCARAHATDA